MTHEKTVAIVIDFKNENRTALQNMDYKRQAINDPIDFYGHETKKIHRN